MIVKHPKRCAEIEYDLGAEVYFVLTIDTDVYVPLFTVKEKRETESGLMYLISVVKLQTGGIPRVILESEPRVVCSNSIFDTYEKALQEAGGYFMKLYKKTERLLKINETLKKGGKENE